MSRLTNPELAELLRRVSAAYLVLNENRFKIIAYDRAAESLDQLTADAHQLWEQGKLKEVPGIGQGIAFYLDELFRTGHVAHFDEVFSQVPAAMFPLLLVPGIGPKKAFKLVTELKLVREKTVVADLEKAAKANKIAPLDGFGEKSEADILDAIATYHKGAIKENRISLPQADTIAQSVIAHLSTVPGISHVNVLGSLRRQTATIGDIDIAVATTTPAPVIDKFLTYPHQKLIEQGPTGASILLNNGRQVDLRVQTPDKYGAMLQYFTGSKHHNIALRSYALEKGLSLNEHGMKHMKTGKTHYFAREEDLYTTLGLAWVAPELREDKWEIEAARSKQLPHLPMLSDIKGDLHIHSSYDLKSSHDTGKHDVHELLDKAKSFGYEYIGLSDHNPKLSDQSEKQIADIMKKRQEFYQEKSTGHAVKLFVLCEVDILPDGRLALPDAAFDYVDAVVVSLHSSFTQEKKTMTARILKALTHHPKVRIFGHPTGRLLGSREGVVADWPEIFAVAKDRDIALEINSAPQRLDLPDTLVYDAVKAGVRFTIDTDAHAADQMDLMRWGVSVARRGWTSKSDILNTLRYTEFRKWLMKGA